MMAWGSRRTPPMAGTGLGSKIIQTMASALQTRVEYINRAPGTAARLVLTTASA